MADPSSSLTVEQSNALKASTRDAAFALVEDYDYLKDVVLEARVPDRGELRRLSVTLRRLLANRELLSIAAPRIGKVRMIAPNNIPFYALSTSDIIYWQSPGRISKSTFCAITVYLIDVDQAEPSPSTLEKYVDLTFEQFLSQKVLLYYGAWVSRNDVIIYTTIFTSAAHSKSPQSEKDRILQSIQNYARIQVRYDPELDEEHIKYHFVDEKLFPTAERKSRPRAAVDPLQLQNLATAGLLVHSPDVVRLIDIIRAEMIDFVA